MKAKFDINFSYCQLFKETKKWNEFNPKKKQIYIPLVFSVLISIFIYSLQLDDNQINELLKNFSLYMFSSFIGILGFLIGGMAIITGTLNTKIIEIVERNDFVEEIKGVLFSFYFIGVFVLINIISYIILYFLAFSSYPINNFSIFIVTFILTFFTLFVLFYCFSLISTCISMVTIIHKLSKLENKNEESKNFYKEKIILSIIRKIVDEKFTSLEKDEMIKEIFKKSKKDIPEKDIVDILKKIFD